MVRGAGAGRQVGFAEPADQVRREARPVVGHAQQNRAVGRIDEPMRDGFGRVFEKQHRTISKQVQARLDAFAAGGWRMSGMASIAGTGGFFGGGGSPYLVMVFEHE